MLKILSKHLMIVNPQYYHIHTYVLPVNLPQLVEDFGYKSRLVTKKTNTAFVNLEDLKSVGSLSHCYRLVLGNPVASFWGWHASKNIGNMDEVTRNHL